MASRDRHALVRDGWLLALLALVVRLAVVAWAWGRFPPVGDGAYYHRLATRLAAGQGYTWSWPDGVTTYAAHYPIGYPALLAAGYALVGPLAEVAMLVNAAIGAVGCLALHRLLGRWRSRRIAALGALLIALHPGLVSYTPALMTEGVTASVLVVALWLAVRARRTARARQPWAWAAVGLAVGSGALLRPQCLVLAPLFALAAVSARWALRRRLAAALVITLAALACCAPWTLRNCARMGRCALVSVNGGWNLLIGTSREGGGGWTPLAVPESCREVVDEAAKDRCFQRAALHAIAADPVGWLALAPRKLALTFDYCGAGGWYLNESSAVRFDAGRKIALGVVETAYERGVLLLALAAAWPRSRRGWCARARQAVVLAAAAATLTPYGWPAHLGLLGALLLGRSWRHDPLAAGLLAVLGSLFVVHAAYFGAGRYQLMAMPLVCAFAALGLGRLRGARLRRARPGALR
jgi:4-amino-4-deoxy-L-arabinose transferase-like glycosyltransferase